MDDVFHAPPVEDGRGVADREETVLPPRAEPLDPAQLSPAVIVPAGPNGCLRLFLDYDEMNVLVPHSPSSS